MSWYEPLGHVQGPVRSSLLPEPLQGALLLPTVDQLAGFARAGYEILGVIGVDGSASCGVTLTPVGLTGGVPSPGDSPFGKVRYVRDR